MKLALRWFGHQSWASFPQQDTFNQSNRSSMSWLEQAAQFFVQRLMADAEPRVWHTCDAEGYIWWHAHDPVTGRSLHDVSEAEMRAWIEQRYACTPVN